MYLTLEKILSKAMALEKFRSEYLGKRALFIRGAVENIEDFFCKADFQQELENPNSVWKWNAQGLSHIGSSNAKKAAEMGLSLTPTNIEYSNPRVCSLLSSISSSLASPSTDLTASLFQGAAQHGSRQHHERGEIYSLQLHGTEKWCFNEFPAKKPSKAKLIEKKLRPGDFLYIPASTLHKTEVHSSYSLRLNVMRQGKNILNFIESFEEYCGRLADADSDSSSYKHAKLNKGIKQELIDGVRALASRLKDLEDDRFKEAVMLLSAPYQVFAEDSVKQLNLNYPILHAENFEIDPSEYLMKHPKCVTSALKPDPDQRQIIFVNGIELEFDDPDFYPMLRFILDQKAFNGEMLLSENAKKTKSRKERWEKICPILADLVRLGVLIKCDHAQQQRNKTLFTA